jgi:hypothetical protein
VQVIGELQFIGAGVSGTALILALFLHGGGRVLGPVRQGDPTLDQRRGIARAAPDQ